MFLDSFNEHISSTSNLQSACLKRFSKRCRLSCIISTSNRHYLWHMSTPVTVFKLQALILYSLLLWKYSHTNRFFFCFFCKLRAKHVQYIQSWTGRNMILLPFWWFWYILCSFQRQTLYISVLSWPFCCSNEHVLCYACTIKTQRWHLDTSLHTPNLSQSLCSGRTYHRKKKTPQMNNDWH